MDKDFIENNNLEKILKNYLKQENMTINTLSKESKIKLETIKKILENSYNKPHRATLEKLYNLNKLNLDDKECIKNLIEKKEYNVYPRKTEYFLTEKGEALLPILELMQNYGKKYYVK